MKINGIGIDVLNQNSIDDAKKKMPGEGVGVAVSAELSDMIAAGTIVSTNELPLEYANLGRLLNLPD